MFANSIDVPENFDIETDLECHERVTTVRETFTMILEIALPDGRIPENGFYRSFGVAKGECTEGDEDNMVIKDLGEWVVGIFPGNIYFFMETATENRWMAIPDFEFECFIVYRDSENHG